MHKVLYFLGGVVVGCTATYFIINKKAEKQIEKEVSDFKEQYSKKVVQSAFKGIDDAFVQTKKEIVNELNQRKATMIPYNEIAKEIAKDEGYQHNLFTNPPNPNDIHNGIDEEDEYEKTVDTTPPKEGLSDPYTITPDQFVNEQPFFDKITLEYYDDDVLCTEITDEIVTDISGEVGLESLTKFGEYEEDVVYVRNEKRSTDYEIIRQHRKFTNIPEDENY